MWSEGQDRKGRQWGCSSVLVPHRLPAEHTQSAVMIGLSAARGYSRTGFLCNESIEELSKCEHAKSIRMHPTRPHRAWWPPSSAAAGLIVRPL